ncbi:hypothetical protein LCGC14_0604130 [marine sediment metagenome]|uniref:D-lactate dehydrogenase (cytochrome) n=1 Tax=marine sediment metagenome TaxID=412755 RepID=A0A0F9REJ6_9ZZZZ|nr:MAG: putative FAD-linked oxidoreductase [Candidatus Lokiarchaeum sp. GC14_75]
MSNHIISSEKITEEISFNEVYCIRGSNEISDNFASYLLDESKLSGEAELLLFPKSEAEIYSVISFLRENKIRAYISASRTGIVGSSVPTSGAILSTEKMNEITGIGYDKNKGNYFIRVEPGITLQEINDRLMKKEFENITELTPDAKKKFKEENKMFYYPVDPTEMSATIGGTVATNASGGSTLKYGTTREWIKGLRVMLSSGEILDIQRGMYFASKEGTFIINQSNNLKLEFKIPNYIFNTKVKNAAGIYSKPEMDLIDLFIGSEGILGVVTHVDIWIAEKQNLISNVLFFNSEDDAISFVEFLSINKKISPELIEFFSFEALNLLIKVQSENPSSMNIPLIPVEANTAIFFDFPYIESRLEIMFNDLDEIAKKCKTDLAKGWSGYEKQDHIRFKQFRHALPENVNAIIAERKQQFPEFHKLGTDMSVPGKNFRSMMKYYHSTLRNANLEYVIFGHIGDYHVHVNILPKNMEELKIGEEIYEKFARKAVEYGGSISGEHGIGKIKRKFLSIMYTQENLEEMRLIKKTLDPSLILNYGNIISFEKEEFPS